MKPSAPDADVWSVPPSHQRLYSKTRPVGGVARAFGIALKSRTVFLWLCKNGANEPPHPPPQPPPPFPFLTYSCVFTRAL